MSVRVFRSIGPIGHIGPIFRFLLDLLLLAAVLYFAIPPSARLLHPPGFVSTTILDRNGVKLREVLSNQDGVAKWASLSEISPWLVQATIAAEDKRFYQHPGIDLLAISRAVKMNLKARRVVAGGSTITQQLVHNLYHLPRRSILGKLIEACEALRFEMHLSKNQILEAYLNRVPYANQTFGVEAAARMYFGKSSSELSIAEAAFLAAIPQSPRAYDPYRHLASTQQRQRAIIRTLRQRQAITEQQQSIALAEQLRLTPKEQNFRAPHFTDWLLARRAGGNRDRETPLPEGSARGVSLSRDRVPSAPSEIRTTLDWELQQIVEARLKRQVRALRGNNVTNGAVIVMSLVGDMMPHRVPSLEIIAMAGSADYFDEKNDGQVNAALARRQPGSALKPFTYELALEDGATAGELLPDLELAATERSGDFMPRNYDEKFHGPVRLRTALACSYNIPAVRVAERISPDRLLDRLRQLGFKSLNKPAAHYGLALTLGAGDVTLLELCRAFACLANNGQYTTECLTLDPGRWTPDVVADSHPRSQSSIFNLQSSIFNLQSPVLSPLAAYIITDILSDNTARAPAFGEYSVLNLGFPCAVKTGTSKDYRDNWTIGFTSEYLVGVWIGNFDGSPMHGVSGVTGAGPLFRDIMLALHPEPPAPFLPPEEIVEQRICPKSGELCGPDCPNSIPELFIPGTAPTSFCSVHQRLALDRTTGLPATEATPFEEIEEQVFEVYPPLYCGWMQSVGLPFPPSSAVQGFTLNSPDYAGETQNGNLQSSTFNLQSSLSILFPHDNSIFKCDPDVAPEFQSIELSAIVSPAQFCSLQSSIFNLQSSILSVPSRVTWTVDDSLLAASGPPFTVFWPLKPGRHRIRCAVEGQAISDEVTVLVLN